MGFAGVMEAFAEKAMTNYDRVVRETVIEAGDRTVTYLSPVGDPTLWISAPPADYRPGDFRGNWFYSLDRVSNATHDGIGITEVNNLSAMPVEAGGHVHYLSNNLSYSVALERGHSTQAPAGIIAVINVELPDIAYRQARALT
jgi:hypothetical protein